MASMLKPVTVTKPQAHRPTKSNLPSAVSAILSSLSESKAAKATVLRHEEKIEPLSDEMKVSLRVLKGLMGMNKRYPISIGGAANMSSSGTGAINSLINVATVASSGDFIALSSIFDEFFIRRLVVQWEPVSLYNGPIGYLPASNVSSLPLGVASLEHGSSAYSNLGTMSSNGKFMYVNTNKRFGYVWTNSENIDSGVVVDPVSSGGAASQGWCLTSNAAAYTGSIQLLTQSAPPALPVSAALGTFIIHYDIVWRCKN